MIRFLHFLLVSFVVIFGFGFAAAEKGQAVQFDASDKRMDGLVRACLSRVGVGFLPETDVICYNSEIFPEQYLKLNELGPASRLIITSFGGNVATARLMSGILDRRAEPVTIAGPCLSACAMVILPALDRVHIHHTAHIAVHGISMMKHSTWWGWLRADAPPPMMAKAAAQMGLDMAFIDYDAGRDHMEHHLADQGIDIGFIQSISDEMLDEARRADCRVDPDNYWGVLNAEHLQLWLGDRIERMEAFAQSFEEPNNRYFKRIATPIGEKTYIFNGDLKEADC